MKEDLKYKGVDFSDIESDREFYGCTFEECSFARAKLSLFVVILVYVKFTEFLFKM